MQVRAATPRRNPFGAAFRGLIWGGVVLAGLYFSQDHLKPWTERIRDWIAQAQGKASKPKPVSPAPAVASTEPRQAAAKKKSGTDNAADAAAPSPQGAKSEGENARASQPVAAVETAAPAAAPVEKPQAASKGILSLTEPAEVQLAFGRVVLQPGTQLKFVSSEGANVRVLYGNDVVVLPAASTDYVAPSGDAAASAKPAVSPNSLF